jgi:hypothetical protein
MLKEENVAFIVVTERRNMTFIVVTWLSSGTGLRGSKIGRRAKRKLVITDIS